VVTFIQRFGSALNLNIHLHMLVPDGGWTFRGGRACFHRAPAPQQAQLEALLTRLIRRIMRVLVRVGVLVQDDTQPYLDLQARDALDEFGSASVRYRIAIGPLAGQRTMTLRAPTLAPADGPGTSTGPLSAALDGFSINAAVAWPRHMNGTSSSGCADTWRAGRSQWSG